MRGAGSSQMCSPLSGTRLRAQEWLPMAEPPADGFDFTLRAAAGGGGRGGSSFQLTVKHARFLAEFRDIYVLPSRPSHSGLNSSLVPSSFFVPPLLFLSADKWKHTSAAVDLTYRWGSELWQRRRTCTPKWHREGSARTDPTPSNMALLWTCCCPWASPGPGRKWTAALSQHCLTLTVTTRLKPSSTH